MSLETVRTFPGGQRPPCAHCGGSMKGKRPHAVFCSSSCKAAADRKAHARKPDGQGPKRPRRFQCGEDICALLDIMVARFGFDDEAPQGLVMTALEHYLDDSQNLDPLDEAHVTTRGVALVINDQWSPEDSMRRRNG